jgi:F0F1-type ATP synthase epsilon subunit
MLAAWAVSTPAAWAQRPIIRMPVQPAPAQSPTTNPQLQLPKGPIFSAADPLELLKQVNILRGQVAALEQQTATLQGQTASQAKMIDSLKNGLATVSLKGIANTNDLVAVNGGLASLQGDLANMKGEVANVKGGLTNVKGELTNVKSEAASLRSSFNNHKHYQRFGHLLNGKETVDDVVTSVPSAYCKPSKSGSGVFCDAPL